MSLFYNGSTMSSGMIAKLLKNKQHPLLAALLSFAVALALFAATPPSQPPASTAKSTAPTFETAVQPVLVNVCNNCHNPQINSGNLTITPYFQSSSLSTNRDGWAKILAKLKAQGEMPPPGIL